MGFDAEYSYVPASVTTKDAFYEHVLGNLVALLEDGSDEKQNWVSVLASVSSVLFNSYADFGRHFGSEKRVNWAGFYMIPSLYPRSRASPSASNGDSRPDHGIPDLPPNLVIGPYHGRPGCLKIPLTLKRKGVCANAFLSRKTVIVQDVHAVPGHIACDGTTESEVVVPLVLTVGKRAIPIGVLDIDCQAVDAWSGEDQRGLEAIVNWLVREDGVIDWSGLLEQ